MVNTLSHGIPNDLSSFPLYRTILRIIKGTTETLVELFYNNQSVFITKDFVQY